MAEASLSIEDDAIDALARDLTGAPLEARLQLIAEAVPGRLVFTTSFGIEDQAIAHALFASGAGIEIVTLDTGRLFPETYTLWAQTEARYGRRIRALAPDAGHVEALLAEQGVEGFRHSLEARLACCHVRKVALLDRALGGAAGWITGLRAEQSDNRAGTPLVARDPARDLLKLNPLADWDRRRLAEYVLRHRVLTNPLHDRGFLSIGCAPCTRAVRPGEPERAGRWWWEQEAKKECGLHARPRPAAVAHAVPA